MPAGFYTFQAAVACRDSGDFPGMLKYMDQLAPLNQEWYRSLKLSLPAIPVE